MFGRRFDKATRERMETLARKGIETGELDEREMVQVLAWLVMNMIGLQESTGVLKSWFFKISWWLMAAAILVLLFAEKSDVAALAVKVLGL